jgi:nucleoside-diphosphate-sugar epimerase
MHPLPPRSPPAPERRPLAAVTGASGFIGRHLVRALSESGWQVRLLMRREPDLPEWGGCPLQVVPGTLGDPLALERLVEGADAVIHAAGLIKAARQADFLRVNRDGSAAVAAAARRAAPNAHFVHVSSMAAREPTFSDYARSKRAGEDAVRDALGERSTVLRPPPVYGPGDRETLRLFRLAQGRIVPLPGPAEGRVAMIHVNDLAGLIARVAAQAPGGRVLTAADAHPEGYRWDELLRAAARAVGNERPRLVRAPMALLRGVAVAGDVARLFGVASMLNSHKLRELRHRDWSVPATELPQVPGWAPQFDLSAGFADAVAWYRGRGWLSG